MGTAATRLRGRLRRTAPPALEALPTSETTPEEKWQATEQHPFDREHGVDTSGLIWGENLSSGSRNDAWNTAYYGIAPSVFHAPRSRNCRASLQSGATFIDIGSGKGRAVMLASRYPFAKVIGVEISPELHRVAVANLATYRESNHGAARESNQGAAPIELLLADAAAYSFPAGPLVVYLYHPFCRPVLERVLRNLQASL